MKLVVELNPQATQYLKKLREDLGAHSEAEVLREGLAVLKWMTDKSTAGYSIVASKEEAGSLQEVEMSNHLLDKLRANAPAPRSG